MAARVQLQGWADMADPPKLSTQQWNVTGLLGVVLIVAAILQAISFGDFKDWLTAVGLSGPTAWAIGLIAAEIIAAASLFKLRMPSGLRMLSALLAILVAGFWFVQNLRLVSTGAPEQIQSSGFFGGFLNLEPGWWSVIGITAFLFWVVYSLRLTSNWSN